MALLFLFWSQLAGAVPGGMTLSGRILKPDNSALVSSNVSFQFSITDPSGSCVVYKETVSAVDMSSSDGNFEVSLGSGTVSFPTGGTTLKGIFDNSATLNCSGGATYTPTSSDVRKLVIQFYDQTEASPSWRTFGSAVTLNSVAQAFYAESAQKLGTNVASDFLLKTGIPTCTAGTFLTYSGSALVCSAVAGASGGTVTNVTSTNSYLTVATGTTTPTLTLNVGTTTGTVAAGDDSRIVNSLQSGAAAGGDLTGTYPNPLVAKLSGSPLVLTGLANGSFLKYSGSAWVSTLLSSSDLSDAGSLIKASQMPANCTTNQTLIFSSPTGTWSCAAISISGSAFGSQTAGTFLAAPVATAGIPSFRALASTDLPSGVVTVGTYRSVTVDTYGRVTSGTSPSTLAGYGITDAFSNGGNAFGAAAALGTNDANSLVLKTNSVARVTVDSTGAIGIGGDPQAGDSLYLSRTNGSTAGGWQIGTDVYVYANPAAASTTNFVGAYATQSILAGTTSNLTGDLVGVRGNFDHQGSGTAQWGYGVRGVGYNSATGTVTNLVGISGMATTMAAGNPTNSIANAFAVRGEVLGDNPNATIGTAYGGYFVAAPSAGTVTNAVGVYIGSLYGANKWGVYQDDNTARNFFNGRIGLGIMNPAYQLQLSTDAAAKPGTSTWTIASDKRLKDIRAPFVRGLEALEQIHPIYFRYKENNPLGLPSNKEYVGIIAQDAQKAVPESVDVDDQGYLHVTNDAIIWTIFNSVKELYHNVVARFDSQDRTIASVKDENAALKARVDQAEARADKAEKENAEIKARLERIEKFLDAK